MALYVNGTEIVWYENSIYLNGTEIHAPDDPADVYLNGTKVFGLTGFSSETLLTTLNLAPDSADIENWVSGLTTTITDAFHSHGYTQGPGTDTQYQMYIKAGYRWVTGDGTFTGSTSPTGTSVTAYSGKSVTGFNTSHNGGVTGYLYRDDGI